MTRFKRIKQITSLADEVYERISFGVATGLFGQNERIVQEKLADEMEVSRTPVREALLRLERDGILVRAGRSGFQIRRFTEQDATQIYLAREAIECYAFGLLCEMWNERLMKELGHLIKQVEGEERSSVVEYFEANRTIHRAFVEHTRNPFLLEMFDMIWNRTSALHIFSELDTGDLSRSVTGHLALCEILNQGSPDAAAEAMQMHIRDGLQLQRNAMKSRIQYIDKKVASGN